MIGTRGYPSYYGGFETLVRGLSPYLVDKGWVVDVYSRPGNVAKDDPLLDRRVTSVETRGLEKKSLSTLSYGLTASLDSARKQHDVALVMNVANGFWLPLLKKRGISTVVNVDGLEWERAKWGKLAKSTFYLGAKLTARYADKLVYDSAAISNYWGERFGREGQFIPYGGDSEYPTLETPRFAPGTYILMVARFVPENSIQEFLDAISGIESHDVVVVGSSGFGGPFEDQLRSMSAKNRNIHWLGHIKDDRLLFSLWENCAAYFHGHSVGGTNPALVQAMACGAPTVARDTVYNREVLADNAVFVEPESNAIARALVDVASSKAKQSELRNGAIARASVCYTWPSVYDAYHELLESALSPKP
ncbi:MAG: glycosyl transferase [Gordonia sp.]|nr:glycosyl transferase [Gordonia sp. (in: high G+C Gram-positive bacteria)]